MQRQNSSLFGERSSKSEETYWGELVGFHIIRCRRSSIKLPPPTEAVL